MSTKQISLEGDEVEEVPNRYWCSSCKKWHLTYEPEKYGEGHVLYHTDDEENLVGDASEESEVVLESQEPEKVGELFRIELSYSVSYTFTIPAWSKHIAEERAKDLRLEQEVSPTELFHVHTDADSIREIYEDDEEVPNGYSSGDGPLYEVYGEGE